MKLFNIHNAESFYKVIDSCKAPVLVTASDGRTEDFRNNALLREVAETASQGNGISEIELHTSCPQDTMRLLDYLTYGYTGAISAKKSA